MDATLLKKYLNNPQLLKDKSVLENLSDSVVDFPYSQTLRILYLMSLKINQASSFVEELKKAALFIADRKILYYLLEDNFAVETRRKESDLSDSIASPVDQFVQDENQITVEPSVNSDKTIDLIDSFLETLPEAEVYNKGLELASDYTGYLLEEGEEQVETPMDGQDLIDEFIRAQTGENDKNLQYPTTNKAFVKSEKTSLSEKQNEEMSIVKQEAEPEDEGFFTETLSRIYVKQQRYDKALEILKKLSLKYPNKNAYFADQIRFLEKLIINDKSK